jgi:uncharacterized membrane protein
MKPATAMLFTSSNIVLLCTAGTTALIAGLFYNWANTITPGLSRLADKEYITAMQVFNRTIQNPLFFICFLGAAVLLPVCSYLHHTTPLSTRNYLLMGATVLYLAGVMAVTIFGNIPLNEALDKFDVQNATGSEIARQRLVFEARWNGLNLIRTLSCILSFLLVLTACIYKEDS